MTFTGIPGDFAPADMISFECWVTVALFAQAGIRCLKARAGMKELKVWSLTFIFRESINNFFLLVSSV